MTLQATLTTLLNTFDWSNIHGIAFLYTDPGSGALIWQLVLASIFGALFYARSFIRRIAALISNGRSRSQSHRQAVIDPQLEEKGNQSSRQNPIGASGPEWDETGRHRPPSV